MKQYKLINNVLGWIVFLIASYTYLSTIEPTGSFWDCGEFIASAYKLEVGHPPGAPFFMLMGNLFTQFTSDTAEVAKMVNRMSALFSALTILFLFWSITHMARRIILKEGKRELTLTRTIMVMGCGLVGALVYTFSDTFWFSAVEGEVYASSSLFTAVVFWLILKWEEAANRPHSDRWIVLIAYFMGLSIGVHLLNLLCIPAIVLVYYYRKFQNPTFKGTAIALLVSFAIVGLMMYGVVQGLVEACGWFELLFVNGLGMPYNSGVYAYVLIIAGMLGWSIWETMREDISPMRVRISFILTIALLGIPFLGSGYVLGILLLIALTVALFRFKNINVRALNTILVSLMVIVVGYSSYALILIRSTADTPMNQNAPKDIFTLRSYLAREQYGDTPLIYGRTYVSVPERNSDGTAVSSEGAKMWSRAIKKDKNEKDHYFVSYTVPEYKYVSETMMLFPRMHSSEARHVAGYKSWANVKGTPVRVRDMGETKSVMKPTFAENIKFFVRYQLNFMYWRYFMWNFSGRQNDIQGHGEIMNGNWITGIKPIDTFLVGPQDDMPFDIANNKGHNVYYMLPLLLGLLGIFYQLFSGKKGMQSFWVTFFLFFMTGIAIVLYLNQTPLQPRERDYAYAGSFYAYCIWIGLGVGAVARALEKFGKLPGLVAGTVATLACVLVPIQMAGQNWDDHDRSGRYMCRDFGSNYLESCEPNAVIFTNGDNDTFPLWYAQEVEGIRTDVRVCNTSYLQTDWYIDQMKRQAYESAPLPITWDRSQYIQGKRDMTYVIKRMDKIDLGQALEFLRSDDPRTKRLPGYQHDIPNIPSNVLTLNVDSATVIKHGAISPQDASQMVKEMTINLSGKDVLGKEAVTILDMLYTNNWKRPIYFAITVDPNQFVRLDPYFQKTGMAYHIVPYMTQGPNARAIDTEKMYDNVMNKFRWGGVDKPGVYIDENTMRMCKSYRMYLFGELAQALLEEGKSDKAQAVLDRCMEVLPVENVPLDYSALMIGDTYMAIGQKEKGASILDGIIENSLRNIRWYMRLNARDMAGIRDDWQRDLAIVQNALGMGMQYDRGYGAKYREEFQKYHMAFQGTQDGGRNR